MKGPTPSIIILGLTLSLILGTSPGFADPIKKSDPFNDVCNAIFDNILKSLTFSYERPPGGKRFTRDFRLLMEKQGIRASTAVSEKYMELAHQEWLTLLDPTYHVAVLKYPVPEAAIETLDLALKNHMTPAALQKMIGSLRPKSSQKVFLKWTADLLEHPRFKEEGVLQQLVTAYQQSRAITHHKVKYLTGIPVIPAVQAGHVRLYKGSNFYKGPSISQSQVGLPLEEVKDGGMYFLDQSEANVHSVRAEAFHPDGVSVSLDKTVPLNYGSHIRIYDVPKEIVDRLPGGALGLREYVFKYSVPERYRVLTLPKASYLEALKESAKETNAFAKTAQILSDREGRVLMDFLKSDREPVLIRGRRTTIDELYRGRVSEADFASIEKHTEKGLQQLQKLGDRFQWSTLEAPPNLNVKKTLQFAYSLHDIGKPFSAELKAAHQEVSAEILTGIMNRAGFSKAEVDLGRALVDHDILGTLFKGGMTPQEAFEKLVEVSKKTNLSPKDFFRVQTLFYTADASAYEDLAIFFKSEGGTLIPKSEKYQVLKNLFENVSLEP